MVKVQGHHSSLRSDTTKNKYHDNLTHSSHAQPHPFGIDWGWRLNLRMASGYWCTQHN